MLRIATLVLAGTLVMAGSASATPFVGTPSPALSPVFGTLINFDDRATGTAVGAADYAGLGVTITEATAVGFFGRYAGSQSLPNYIGTGPTGGGGTGWDGDFNFVFSLPATRVGIGIADSQGVDTLFIYDVNGVLIESVVAPVGSNVYAGFNSLVPIGRLRVVCDFCALDDLQFNRVPEPASMLLLGTGLAFAARRIRRRRQS